MSAVPPSSKRGIARKYVDDALAALDADLPGEAWLALRAGVNEADQSVVKQAPPNEHWCVGCSPDNCVGCPPERIPAEPEPEAGADYSSHPNVGRLS